MILRKEVTSMEIIDAALFEKILEHLKEKQKQPSLNIENVKNFFDSPLKASDTKNDLLPSDSYDYLKFN
jgi:hypothetical protein